MARLDHLWQSWSAILGPGAPSMATKIAVDGLGDQLWWGTTCGMTDPVILAEPLFFAGREKHVLYQIFEMAYGKFKSHPKHLRCKKGAAK